MREDHAWGPCSRSTVRRWLSNEVDPPRSLASCGSGPRAGEVGGVLVEGYMGSVEAHRGPPHASVACGFPYVAQGYAGVESGGGRAYPSLSISAGGGVSSIVS